MSKQTAMALIIGGMLGAASLEVGAISTISANPVLGSAQTMLMSLLIPGLIGSMAIAGNVHAFSLGAAAVINCVLYFSLVTVVWRIASRFVRKRCG